MKNSILLIFLIVLVASCAKDSDPTTDQANFTRIYDNNKFDASNYPIDIKQTSDGGFLILGGRRLTDSNFSGAYLMKVDELGMFVSELEVPSDKVAPIGPLLVVNDKYYFFTMTAIGLKTELHEALFARTTIASAFQRMIAHSRSSIARSPGNVHSALSGGE